jgi:predicted porin
LNEGLVLHAQYAPEEGMIRSLFISGSGVYRRDDLMVGFGYERHGKALEPADLDLSVIGKDSSAYRAVAGYEVDGFQVGALFQMIENAGGYKDITAMTYGLGASYRLDNDLEPKAQYYMMDPDTDTDDDAAGMLVVGLAYHLNKKAQLYLNYAVMMNQDEAMFAPFRGGHGKSYGYGAEEPGQNPYGFSLGLIARW